MSDLRKALEQALKALDSGSPELQLPAVIKVLIEMAVLAEREACAKVCEELVLAYVGNASATANQCAEAIRARGEK